MSDLELTMMRRVGELNKENARLKEEVERMTLASQGAVKYVDHTMALTRQSMEHHKQVSRLEAQVERLTKAGDALTEQLEGLGFDSVWDFWNAAKEGNSQS
jgi:predicted RNase H-like nuclease (RuvC/YqgF family)